MRHRFRPFELDEEAFELTVDGKPIQVQKLVLETIAFLIRHRDRVVSKEELIAGPWKSNIVSDATLNHTIMLARRALSDDAAQPKMIRTIRGKGFRFVGEVTSSTEPSRAPRVAAATVVSSGDAQFDGSFVGRSGPLASLNAAARAALGGQGTVLLVGGEPGIGKTTLLGRFAASLSQADVLWGRCWESGGAPVFSPWLEVSRAYIARYGTEWFREAMGPAVVDIANQLPDLRERLVGAQSAKLAQLEDSPQARFRMFGSVAHFLERAAAQRPLVVLLDDLHVADEASVRLLEYLMGTVKSSPLLIVGAFRALDAGGQMTESLLAGSLGNAERFVLSGLNEDEVAQLLESVLGSSASPEAARSVRNVTGGNPFLVREVGLQLAAKANPTEVERELERFRLPDRVAGIVREHIGRLPAKTMELLAFASVIGQGFQLSLLGDLLSVDTDELLQRLESALMDKVLVQSRSLPLTYAFGHALTRETIYRDLPLVRRLDLHYELACRLEESRPDEPALIAHHFLLALPKRGADKALTWSLKAGETALQRYAYESAAVHFAKALELAESIGEPPARSCTILLSLARAQGLAGRQGEAIGTLAMVETRAADQGLYELAAEALLGTIEIMREAVYVESTFPGRVQRALDAIPESNKGLHARLMAALAYCSVLSRSASDRLVLCERAISLAREVGDKPTLIAVLRAAYWTVSQSSAEKSLEVASALIDAARAAGQPEKVLDAHMWRTGHFLGLGRAQEFQAEMDEHASLARKTKHPWHTWWAKILEASRAQLRGTLGPAEVCAREAFGLGLAVQGPTAALFFATQMLTIGCDKDVIGRRAAISEVYPLVRKLVDAVPMLRVWFSAPMILMDCELGSIAEARVAFEHVADAGFDKLPDDQILIANLVCLARVARFLGDTARARTLYDMLVRYDGLHVSISIAAAHWGPVSHYLGILATMLADNGRAEVHFRQAIKQSRELGAPLCTAWSEYELGRLLGSRASPEQRRHGADLLRSAMTAAQRLGLPQLETDASNALRPGAFLRN